MDGLSRRQFIIPFVLLSVIQLSCSSSRKAQRVTLDPVTVTANKAALDIYRASETRVWDISHTRVDLSFDLGQKTANGQAWIKMSPYFYATDTILLDAKGMQIAKVALAGDTTTSLVYTYAKDELKIKLGRVYTKEDKLELYIRYTAMPYATQTGGSNAITDDRGLYFINTDNKIPGKPAQIWTQGETESNAHWLPTIDKPNERFTVALNLTVPDSFVTLGNGSFSGMYKRKNGLRTDMWAMNKPIQTYAIMFAIGKFAIVNDEWNNKEVNYYVEPEYEPYAHRMFRHTPEMMEYFSRITGVPYPWNKYSQVVVRDYVSGAMENTTASLFGEFMNQNMREMADKDYEDVVSHELFHQWFGDYVTAESWSNLTVNESFANYSEQLWRKHKYGSAKADELAYDDLQGYLSQSASVDPPLVRYHYESREDMFDRISYEKGGAILHYLNGLMGDEAFYKAMNLYLTKNALQPAEASQWRTAVEDATGKDWNWFFNQWYYRGGHPVLDVQYTYNDAQKQLEVTVLQKQKDLYRLPLKTLVAYSSQDKYMEDWELTTAKQAFSYPYKNGIKPTIVPDVAHWLPGEIKENKQPAHWLAQYRLSDDFISKYVTLAYTIRKTDDSSTQSLIGLALRDTNATLREGAMDILQTVKKDNLKKKWLDDVKFAAENDASNKVRAAAFMVLGTWKEKTAKDMMVSATTDSSYMVAGAALNALGKINKDTAYTIAKGLLSSNPRASLQYNIWSRIAQKGSGADIDVYEKNAYKVYGTQRIQLAINLSQYLRQVKEDDAFNKGLALFHTLIASENIKNYRLALGTYMLETAEGYKDKVADSQKNVDKDTAKKRLELIRIAAEKMVKEETEEENRKVYNTYMKKLFGNGK